MFRALILLFALISSHLSAQTFRVSPNVISASLFQPFASTGGYTLAFERLVDPGYSINVSQFSYRLGATLISDSKKSEIYRIGDQVFFDQDAYKYSGYLVVPELKFYFVWNAPMGIYLNVFGTYSDYLEKYTDEKQNSFDDFDKKYNEIGRGIGTGFQFCLYKNLTLDMVGGYHLSSISSKTKLLGEEEFTKNPKEKDDGLYMNVYLGINF